MKPKNALKAPSPIPYCEYPARRITINLAPAQLPKDGTHYDLPIALAILISSGQLRQSETELAAFAGELALDGSLRPIKGAITMAETAKRAGLTHIYLPVDNAEQASLVAGIDVIGLRSLKELYLHLKQEARYPLMLPLLPKLLGNSLPTHPRSMMFMDKSRPNVR